MKRIKCRVCYEWFPMNATGICSDACLEKKKEITPKITTMKKSLDTSWNKKLKRKESDLTWQEKRQRKIKRLSKKKKAIKPNPEKNLFNDKRWQQLRYHVIRTYGRKCMACGKTEGEFHVDHIKPRSRHPELTYNFNNLQVLCRDCNMGKGAHDEKDWRLVK